MYTILMTVEIEGKLLTIQNKQLWKNAHSVSKFCICTWTNLKYVLLNKYVHNKKLVN